MSDHTVKEFTHNGYTVRIKQDMDGGEHANPRDGVNVGVMLANGHRNHTLGDDSIEDLPPATQAGYEAGERKLGELIQEMRFSDALVAFKAWATQELGTTVVLPLYLLDHSGLAMRTGPFMEDPGGWDSGVVGIIYDTAATREETGCPVEGIEGDLRAEVKLYDSWLHGDVYGYVIEDPDGDVVGSCWGFLAGMDDVEGEEDPYVVAQAKDEADSLDPLQWIVVDGTVAKSFSFTGPYDVREDAVADAEGSGEVVLLKPPPEKLHRVVVGASDTPALKVGEEVNMRLTAKQLRERLAQGWKLESTL